MAAPVPPPTIPLPKGWSDRVRSAVVHAISLAHFSLTTTRSWAASSWNTRIRLKAENDRLRQELALVREEMRIKDSRMLRISAHRRPHYPPTERLAILELRAARAWSLSQTARQLLVTTATVASWMSRLNEEGPRAIVQIPVPVNKFPDLVTYIVQRLQLICPTMGKAKIAQVLCRAGLHLGATTVARKLEKELPHPFLAAIKAAIRRPLRTRRPNQVWNVDLTTVPTSMGFWASWLPFALPQCGPFCWWVAVAVDHYSSRLVGVEVFENPPTSAAMRSFLRRVMRELGAQPEILITDQGTQFTDAAFGRWCERRGIRQRFGAVGKYGSIAVVERLIRTIKTECTRRVLVPYSRRSIQRELSLFALWYNEYRPHESLGAGTPDEVYRQVRPACRVFRFEPRRKWPRNAPCAAPDAPVRGRRGVRLELSVSYLAGRRHLPIVSLDRAA